VSEETVKNAAAASVKNAKPLSQNAHKVHLAQVAVKRAVLKAGGAA
jgi:CO/xanthine dehydrogenase FAD-binding subunit